ncbi:hypothetical protein DUI87_08881 [Hirundo rustica rustica]|uniref:Uncharacterized protein n=1 Tax=Hirundo rustica rustica TaxID=333673 RepID=A0A3M0KKL4_HIRRU|nr:hypothetical protein DUI87_08881 [Hirundo rustica rustica]
MSIGRNDYEILASSCEPENLVSLTAVILASTSLSQNQEKKFKTYYCIAMGGKKPNKTLRTSKHNEEALIKRAGLDPFSAQPVPVLGIALTQVQDLGLSLSGLHDVHTDPPLKPV